MYLQCFGITESSKLPCHYGIIKGIEKIRAEEIRARASVANISENRD